MTNVKSKYRGTIEYALVYCELIKAARYHGIVTYKDIAKLIGLPLKGNYTGRMLGIILGEISEDEFSHGRPMLSAIAVGVNGLPGEGFYKLARELAKLTTQADEEFWLAEKNAVYDTWEMR